MSEVITAAQYSAWASDHQAMFGMSGNDAEAQMFKAWFRLFVTDGYTERELRAATDTIARLEQQPEWRGEHLAAIQRAVRESRRRRRETAASTYRDTRAPSQCEACDDVGMVAGLPQLFEVRDGLWVGHATCAVLCRCHAGQRIGAAFASREWPSDRLRERACFSIVEYEAVNPHWREQLADRRALLIAQRMATEATRAADSSGRRTKFSAAVSEVLRGRATA